MRIAFPTSATTAVAAARAAADEGIGVEFRAGGTDWQERHELGLTAATVIDLRDVAGLDRIEVGGDRALRVGARVRLRELASAPALTAYPALCAALATVATPQIRAVATLGGSLLQRSRCWYYRSALWRCFKSGGTTCPARAGDHSRHACFDLGPCIAPHPSTIGVALLACEARLETHTAAAGTADTLQTMRTIAELFGDGSDPTRDQHLASGELLTAVHLPPPVPGESGGYFRAITRAAAEWPLVEVATRLQREGDRITAAAVVVGGIANIPLRLRQVEDALTGSRGEDRFAEASELARAVDAGPKLPMTGYKLEILPAAVLEALHSARPAGMAAARPGND